MGNSTADSEAVWKVEIAKQSAGKSSEGLVFVAAGATSLCLEGGVKLVIDVVAESFAGGEKVGDGHAVEKIAFFGWGGRPIGRVVFLVEGEPRSTEAIATETRCGLNGDAAEGDARFGDTDVARTESEVDVFAEQVGERGGTVAKPDKDAVAVIPAIVDARIAVEKAFAVVLMKEVVVRESGGHGAPEEMGRGRTVPGLCPAEVDGGDGNGRRLGGLGWGLRRQGWIRVRGGRLGLGRVRQCIGRRGGD